ncbi:SGNH/GDSL hydrolase family protein [Specibacter cremeus]|uniref:SGNH/GDSL hydrolase family protein n=1 Tax=Specibacter cremeus TaxID=1629051 RepID=UPI000F7AC275|nr:SGNH/GDSL hydrolase family protein [Specibacter cremeus]
MKRHQYKVFAARTGAAALVSLGLVAGFAGAPAMAESATQTLTYTVLGDSYSAGSGGGGESGPCRQSPHGYGNDVAADTGAALTVLACYGATTDQVRTSQVPNMPAGTKLVTLTVGGNDVGTGTVAAACVSAPKSSACTAAVANALYQMTRLPTKISALVKAVKAKAPRARVVFLGYPHLFEPSNMVAAGYPADQVAAARTINTATDLLDGVIGVGALTNGASFVSVTRAFAGHGIPSASPWLISPLQPSPFPFHPNATGYRHGYAATLEAAL